MDRFINFLSKLKLTTDNSDNNLAGGCLCGCKTYEAHLKYVLKLNKS